MKPLFRSLSLFMSFLFLCGCAATRRGTQAWVVLPESMEISVGQGVATNVAQEYKSCPSGPIVQYVQSLGQKVVSVCDRKGLNYQFTVLDSTIVNAFAAPGGYIYVTTGLLKAAENEAELVVVLGHEVGHVVAKHGAQRIQAQFGLSLAGNLLGLDRESPLFQNMVGLGENLALQGYGRENELEADWYGALYASRLGYDPKAAVTLFEKLKKLEAKAPNLLEAWLASHPPSDARIAEFERIKGDLPSQTGFLRAQEYSRAVSSLKS